MIRLLHVGAFLAVLCASERARAQVLADEVLVDIRVPGSLRHYRADGTFVASTPSSPFILKGVDILPDGRWVSSYGGGGAAGLAYFAPTGDLISYVPAAQLPTNGSGDVGAFSDGRVIVATDVLSKLVLFDAAGVYLATWGANLVITPTGCVVDALGEVWVADPAAGRIWHFDELGGELAHITTIDPPIDVDEAPDGTLWASFQVAPRLRQFARDGTLLASFDPQYAGIIKAIAVASDGGLWVGNNLHPVVWRHAPDGDQLYSFPIAGLAEFLAVPQALGARYCSQIFPNSAGTFALMDVSGSRFVAQNDLTLSVEGLPAGQFGYFLVGSHQDVLIPPGSQGFLCVGCTASPGCGLIGRFSRPGEILVGPSGSLDVDLNTFPVSGAPIVQPGDTWNFQCWYRDGATSNVSDALSVAFR